jgi:hypothetical protein
MHFYMTCSTYTWLLAHCGMLHNWILKYKLGCTGIEHKDTLTKGYKEPRNGHKGCGRRWPMPINIILQFLLLGGTVAMQRQEVQGGSAAVAKPGEWQPLKRWHATTIRQLMPYNGGRLVPGDNDFNPDLLDE